MSVTIRLSRIGRKNLPAYKIVVANTRDKRDGRSLDILGHYNPSMNPESFSIDMKKYKEWKSKGALVTEAVEKLVKGEYKYVPYEPRKVVKKEGGGWAGEKESPSTETPAPAQTGEQTKAPKVKDEKPKEDPKKVEEPQKDKSEDKPNSEGGKDEK